MWMRYSLTLTFLNELCATMPADRNLWEAMLQARKPTKHPPATKSIQDITEELLETMPDPEEDTQNLHVFQRHDGHLIIHTRTVRAHIKDCARVLSSLYVGRIQGEKSFAVKVVNAVYPPSDVAFVPILTNDGKPCSDATGIMEKPIHVRTAQGSRSSIKVLEYVMDAVIQCPLLVLTTVNGKPVIAAEDLDSIFEYGGTHGYGGERGDGYGRYVFTLTKEEGDG